MRSGRLETYTLPSQVRLVQRTDRRRDHEEVEHLRHRAEPLRPGTITRNRLAERDQPRPGVEEGVPLPAREGEPEVLQLDLDRLAHSLGVVRLLLPVERPHLARVAAAAVRSEHQGAAGQVQRVRGRQVLGHQLHEDLVFRSDRDSAADRGDLDGRIRRRGRFRRRRWRGRRRGRGRHGCAVRATAAAGPDDEQGDERPGHPVHLRRHLWGMGQFYHTPQILRVSQNRKHVVPKRIPLISMLLARGWSRESTDD